MSQDALFLVAVAVVAGYMVRLAVKLAPLGSEFPLKTLLASLLSAAVAFAGVLPYTVGEELRIAVLIAGPIYGFGPLLAITLARWGRYRISGVLVSLLYWTAEGRSALRRLLAQVALQRGEVAAALELIPDGDSLMLAQAYALAGEWDRVLTLELPRSGDNSFLGEAARIEALLGLGRTSEAEQALNRMETRWEAGQQGPLGYRAVRISGARVAAERGDLGRVKELLGQPLPGVPAHRVLAIFARGALQSGRLEDAGKLYRQAYAVAPEPWREVYRPELEALAVEPPTVASNPHRPVVTIALGAGLALAYLAQLWFDANYGPFAAFGQAFDASTLAAAFLLDMPPGLPAWDAWWRYLSYTLVHGNLLHIGFNVWVLIDIGRVYEARRGGEGVLASFVGGAAMGALITVMAHQGGPLVLIGASGGVLGVAGALLADALASRTASDRALAGSLLRWMALIVLLSVTIPNVSLWGHVGGVVGGMLWGFIRQGLPRARSFDAFAGAVALAVLSVALARALVLAARLMTI